jgi:hypothetical protein
MTGHARRTITPVLAEKGIKVWKGLYAGRRAAATLLVQLTGNALAAQYVPRHSNLSTTTAFYVKPSRQEAVTGMRLVGEKLELTEKFKFTPKALPAAQ